MNKKIHLVALGILFTAGMVEAEYTTLSLDKDFLRPLVDIVSSDINLKLDTLYRFEQYLQNMVDSEVTPLVAPLLERKQSLIEQEQFLQATIDNYKNRWPVNFYKAILESQASNELDKITREKQEIEKKINSHLLPQNRLNSLRERINLLEERKNHIPAYLVTIFTAHGVDAADTLASEQNIKLLPYRKKIYEEEKKEIQSADDSDYLRYYIANHEAPADTDSSMYYFLITQAALLASNLKQQHPQEFDLIFNYYIQYIKKTPEYGPRFSLKEVEPFAWPSLKPSAPLWMSTIWQRGKDTAARWLHKAADALDRSAQRMAPYDTERALEESQYIPQMRPESKIREDLVNRYQQARQNWAHRYQQAQQIWKYQMPKMRNETIDKFDTAEKATQFFDDYR